MSIVGTFFSFTSYSDQTSAHSKVKPPKKPVHECVVEAGEPLHGKGYTHCKKPKKNHKTH